MNKKLAGGGVCLIFALLVKQKTVCDEHLEFNQLLVSRSDFLRGFALGFTRNGADADDLVQDTMVKALRYKNNFKEGTNMKGWLYTIMRNIFINNYKRKKFQNTVLDSTENYNTSSTPVKTTVWTP